MSAIKIPILYHQHGILVVDKPYGLASQPTQDGAPNLFSLLQQQFPYVAIHHRLDTPASGVLLFCTDKRWNKAIGQDFQERRITREYWTACLGTLPQEGYWKTPIEGRKARTNFRLIKQCYGYACLQVSLETGRKHQIRIHSSQAGHPILGDRRYAESTKRLCHRLALHAHKISFLHPALNEWCTVESPLPPELHSLLSK